MEILLVVVVAVIIGALIYVNNNRDVLDTNKDGKIDAQEVKQAAVQVKKEVKAAVKKTAVRAKAKVAATKKKVRK